MATAEQRARYLAHEAAKFQQGVKRGAVRLTINDDAPGDTTGFDRVFAGLGAVIDNFPAALAAAVPTIRQQFADNFRREAAREAWAPLAPVTIRERIRLGYGRGPKLRRTGALMRHVLTAPPKVSRAGGDVALRIRPGDSVGGVPKYRALARGTGRMPARPMVVINSAGAVKVTSAISRALRSYL